MTRKLLLLLAAALPLLLIPACGGAPTEPRDFEFGRIDVYVRDVAGQPVDGVGVRLENPGGSVEDAGGATGTAGLPGYYFFLRVSGNFRIRITVPTGYQLAPGQTDAQNITFQRNTTKTINFILQHV